ncbi:uncharacterized protein [Epargyreus clarus]|uniref:uncharacterized protein n=1 Tax=Epargyreus clarus TaxID=520877 RepID=UPI003C2B5171
MFGKAKRFENNGCTKNQAKAPKKSENEKNPIKIPATSTKVSATKAVRSKTETQSLCSSIPSTKSFVTPKPIKTALSAKGTSSLKKSGPPNKPFGKEKTNVIQDELIKAHEVEIRNKDFTIAEYNKQVEELKNELAVLHKLLKENPNCVEKLDQQFSQINLQDNTNNCVPYNSNDNALINSLQSKICELEKQCDKLEQEVSSKQVELTSLETIITIRDSLCEDLQKKLTDMESCLDETRQRLEMVKGHHALALEANESIRREYKAELETIKNKFEEERQSLINKCKSEQENVRVKYNNSMESIKRQIMKEKDERINELQQELIVKDQEMQAKLEQIDEATHEKLRLCEIQFEERSRSIQEHCNQQHNKIQSLEREIQDLKYTLKKNEEQHMQIQKDMNNLRKENELIKAEKMQLIGELNEVKEDSKKKLIDFENEKNKLTVEVDRAMKEKQKFEMSLSVTRDIVQVLSMRLRESDNELEHLENKVQSLTNSKELLEDELTSYKNTLNNTAIECNEYKEALVNILKSKAALAKEHNRIMEHNVSLIESLQNVEKEAIRELGSIKNELLDVELIKKESLTQIQKLQDEVEKKRKLCELATEHAGQATAAAEQSRALLAAAAAEISRLESDNRCLQQQIQDQQSLVVELSLLRQENEELTMSMAKQSSIIDKLKKDIEQAPKNMPKSPSLVRKTQKIGKENVQNIIISPLRERNH